MILDKEQLGLDLCRQYYGFIWKSKVTNIINNLGSILFTATALPAAECPEQHGVQAYGHTEHCDQFFLCTNGTLTLETCENGLLFDGKGAVHNHCNYNWAVDCGERKHDGKSAKRIIGKLWFNFFFLAMTTDTPISTPACEYLFGIYPDSHECSTSFVKCAFGEPHQVHCEAGLAYDERIHGCNWPDQLLEICNPEGNHLYLYQTPHLFHLNFLFSRCWFHMSRQFWLQLVNCPILAVPSVPGRWWSTPSDHLRRGTSTVDLVRRRHALQRGHTHLRGARTLRTLGPRARRAALNQVTKPIFPAYPPLFFGQLSVSLPSNDLSLSLLEVFNFLLSI